MNRREAINKTALLLGCAISVPAVMGILNGCKSSPRLNYQPKFLTKEQAVLVGELAEIILPKTDTPGAKDVGVPAFIDTILDKAYPQKDKERFIKGLKEFDEEAIKTYKENFAQCNPNQQLEIVKKYHNDALAGLKNKTITETPFILMVKELTILGFFTSEPGATKVLQYLPVPGAYHGCVPLEQTGKAWAT